MADRFPHLLQEPDDRVRIFVAPSAEEVQAVTLSRRFECVCGVSRRPGVMVGLVATYPAARGRGLASALLERARVAAVADGAEFAVLWTGNPGFYRRLGWTQGDRGLLGELSGCGPVGPVPPPDKLDSESLRWVEAVRAKFLPARIEREPSSYRILPAPVDRLELYRCSAGAGDAYALAGRTDGLSVLYELVGASECFEQLWSSIRRGSDAVLVNGAVGDEGTDWLKAQGGIAWRPQPLAMWLPLTENAQADSLTSWHVPFLDRI